MSYTDQDNAGTSLFSAQGYRPDMPIYNDNGEFDMSTGQANPVANTYKKTMIIFTASWEPYTEKLIFGKDSGSVPVYRVIYNLLKTIHSVQVSKY